MREVRPAFPAFCLILALAALGCGRNAALKKGRQFLEIGDLGKAIEQFSQAVQDDPKLPLGHYYLARSYCLADSADLACKEYGILNRLDHQAAQDTFLRQKVSVYLGLEPYALTRLTFEPGNDALPALSPDGRKIAFSSKRDGNTEIYIMDADGQNPKRITNNPGLDYMPAFSPDGKSLAYVSDRDGNDEIYLCDLQTQKERRLTANKFDDLLPRFSPDGQEIFYLSDRDGRYCLWRMSASGGEATTAKMVTDSLETGGMEYYDISSGQILYQQEQENKVILKIWPLTGGQARQLDCPMIEGGLTTIRSADLMVETIMSSNRLSFRAGIPTVLSPDGRYLLYTSSRQGNDEVYLYDRQAEYNLRLTVNPAEDMAFGIFPDQKTVLFDSQRDGDREVYLLHLDQLISADQIIKALAQGQ